LPQSSPPPPQPQPRETTMNLLQMAIGGRRAELDAQRTARVRAVRQLM
jgi:hypothetical protein